MSNYSKLISELSKKDGVLVRLAQDAYKEQFEEIESLRLNQLLMQGVMVLNLIATLYILVKL